MDKQLALKAYRNAAKTYRRLGGRGDFHTYFDNFHYAYRFGEDGFCTKDCIISDQQHIEYSDELVTAEDIQKLAIHVHSLIPPIIKKIMEAEEQAKKDKELEERYMAELSVDEAES
jgi:hypothetical protein